MNIMNKKKKKRMFITSLTVIKKNILKFFYLIKLMINK